MNASKANVANFDVNAKVYMLADISHDVCHHVFQRFCTNGYIDKESIKLWYPDDLNQLVASFISYVLLLL